MTLTCKKNLPVKKNLLVKRLDWMMVGYILNHRLSLQPYVPQQMFQRFDPRWSGSHHNFCPSSINYNLWWRYLLYFCVWYNKITTKIYVNFAVKEFYYLCHFVSFIIHHGGNRKCILLTIFIVKKKEWHMFLHGCTCVMSL